MSKAKIEEELENTGKSPVRYILAVLLVFLLVLMVFPYYSVKLDPEPKNIPGLNELNIPSYSGNSTSNDILAMLRPNDAEIKQIASTIASRSCETGRVCHAKAVYYFVRDNIDYVGDPPNEYYEDPLETLNAGGADCDGMAILLANLLQAVGIRTRFVFTPGHVFVQANLPEALNRYRVKEDGEKEDWVNLDATCKTCKFGEISYSVSGQEKGYLPQI